MSLNLDCLIPEFQPWARALVDLAGRAGVQPRVTSTCRSRAEQARLYDRYLRGESILPAAPPGTSAHEYGYAIDLVVDTRENLDDLGSVWTSWGGKWGGDRDPVHFEYPGFNPHQPPAVEPAQAARGGRFTHTLSQAADLIISFNPTIGTIELAATLLGMGFPENRVLRFLGSPFATLEEWAASER